MTNHHKAQIMRAMAGITVAALAMSSLLRVTPVRAATVTSLRDVQERLTAATASNHEIKYVIPGGIAAGETLTVTFGTGFVLTSIVEDDVDFATGSSNNCTSATFTEEDTASSPSAAVWGVAVSSQVLTITSGTDTLAADRCVRIRIGTNAVSFGTGANKITNPSAGANTISVGGTVGDSGTIGLSIVDSDQVTVTASVDPSLTFDLDTATTDTESAAAYSVAFGTLVPGTVKSSGGSINSVYVDLSTNATAGAVVTVRNANGANGLVSASVSGDDIDSATATMATASENYGLCVAALSGTTPGTFAEVSPFDGATCTASGVVNTVGGLLTTTQNILTVDQPITAGRAQILVNANAIATTVAHNDYTDTLTFIATGTF